MPNDKRLRFGDKVAKFLEKKKESPNQPNEEVLFDEFPELKEEIDKTLGGDDLEF